MAMMAAASHDNIIIILLHACIGAIGACIMILSKIAFFYPSRSIIILLFTTNVLLESFKIDIQKLQLFHGQWSMTMYMTNANCQG
jgi:hypothetical protein